MKIIDKLTITLEHIDSELSEENIVKMINFGIPKGFAQALPMFMQYWYYFNTIFFDIPETNLFRDRCVSIEHQDDAVIVCYLWQDEER